MTWMTFLYSTFSVLLVVEFWFLMRADLVIAKGLPGWRRWPAMLGSLGSTDLSERSLRRDARIVQVLAALGVPLAIMFSGGVGALFGVLVARPFWHSGLYPVIFLVSALASGAALLALASTIFQEGWRTHREMIVTLGRLVLGLLLLDALILFSEFLIGSYGGRPDWIASLSVAIGGPYWWVFWVAQLGFGFVIPVAVLASPLRLDPRAVAVACGFVLLGFIGVRLNIVLPGLTPEEIAGLVVAVDDPRVRSEYFPSLLEWLMSIGIGGLGLILFGIGEIFLPLSHHLRPLPGDEEGLAEQVAPARAEA
jgi:molybdopterin-containing oxidoreductase family membrane subunit